MRQKRQTAHDGGRSLVLRPFVADGDEVGVTDSIDRAARYPGALPRGSYRALGGCAFLERRDLGEIPGNGGGEGGGGGTAQSAWHRAKPIVCGSAKTDAKEAPTISSLWGWLEAARMRLAVYFRNLLEDDLI